MSKIAFIFLLSFYMFISVCMAQSTKSFMHDHTRLVNESIIKILEYRDAHYDNQSIYSSGQNVFLNPYSVNLVGYSLPQNKGLNFLYNDKKHIQKIKKLNKAVVVLDVLPIVPNNDTICVSIKEYLVKRKKIFFFFKSSLKPTLSASYQIYYVFLCQERKWVFINMLRE